MLGFMPLPASASGAVAATAAMSSCAASACSTVVAVSTTSAGVSSSAVSPSVASGVSGPRKVMRQPWARSASPKQISARSCWSPGTQARRASGPVPLAPAARQAEQPAAQQRAREVLLRDRCLAALPALAEVLEVRQYRVAKNGVERERREQAVERGMRAGLVEPVEGTTERLGEGARKRRARPVVRGRLIALEQRQPGALGGRDTRVQVPDHASHPPLILAAVEAESARSAGGREQSVTTLPGTQQFRAHADAPAQLADPEMPGGVGFALHASTLQTLDRHLTYGLHSLYVT